MPDTNSVCLILDRKNVDINRNKIVSSKWLSVFNICCSIISLSNKQTFEFEGKKWDQLFRFYWICDTNFIVKWLPFNTNTLKIWIDKSVYLTIPRKLNQQFSQIFGNFVKLLVVPLWFELQKRLSLLELLLMAEHTQLKMTSYYNWFGVVIIKVKLIRLKRFPFIVYSILQVFLFLRFFLLLVCTNH